MREIAHIRATMLGRFSLQQTGMKEPRMVSLAGRSGRLWTLVAYLILHRDRGIPAQELIDLLWPDGSGSNPASTLQNNASRARNAMATLGFSDTKCDSNRKQCPIYLRNRKEINNIIQKAESCHNITHRFVIHKVQHYKWNDRSHKSNEKTLEYEWRPYEPVLRTDVLHDRNLFTSYRNTHSNCITDQED